MVYFLMHENTKLALFEYKNQSIQGIVINPKTTDRLPFLNMSSKNIEDRVANWIMNRGIPVTRQRIKVDLQGLDINNVHDYMISNLGLSLTDHYWICPQNSDYTWDTVNLYKNNFKATYSLDIRDDRKTIANKTNFVPSASLKGDLKKKWIIDSNGIRRLVKGNYNNTCRQSLCEVLATEIHRRQAKFEYTPYSLIEISSEGQLVIGCECPNFTDINTEFISASDIIESIKKNNHENYYEAYIKYCGEHGINEEYIRAFMEYQILTDFIISNNDRHLNNFGVIRNSKTFEFIKPAPIFDSGNSMFYNTNNIKVDYGLLNLRVTSFKKFEIQLLNYVTNPMLVDIQLLPSKEEVKSLFLQDCFCNEEIAEKLSRAYTRKIVFLNELQHGTKIYSYNYLKKAQSKIR